MAVAPSSPSVADEIHRTCPFCEAKCGISVKLDRATQQVLTIRGDSLDPFSGGYLCPKAYGLKGVHEDPDRLRRPVRRVGSEWHEIDWDEALDLVALRLGEVRAAHGADAIATYFGNPTAHDGFASLYVPGLQRALGTRWRFSATSVDQLPKMLSSALLYGSATAFPVPDIDRTDLFVVFGANPIASNGSLMTAPDMPGRLRALRARGGRLIVLDPRRSETARSADQHVFLRPGSDALLLFSIVQVLFQEGLVRMGRLAQWTNGVDEVRTLAAPFTPEATATATGVTPDVTRVLARTLVGARTAVVYGRIGTCAQEFGTLASWLIDVVNLLTGNVDRAGGAMWPRAAAGAATDRPGRHNKLPRARWCSHVRGLPEFAGELPVAALAEEIDSAGDSRVRALLTVAGNPVLSTPNGGRLAQALASLDFMVSVDLYRNETTRFADVILPPSSPLERGNFDFLFHGLSVRHHAKWSQAAFEPEPGAKHQWQILLDLTARLAGVTPETVDDLMLNGMLQGAVGRPETPCPNVSLDEARAKLGDVRGPERLFDLRLRSGPFGDRFDDAAPGLSRATLEAHPHGLDLGPMEPRLPALLATPSGAIELAHPLLVADVERLRGACAAPRSGLVLIGRRHLRSNNSWMHNIAALAKGPERCTLLVHPADAERLGLATGGQARVRSRVGELVAPVVVSDELMPGVVSLPHGFGHAEAGVRLAVASLHAGVNSNLLTDELQLDALSGNAVLNGIPVDVEAA